ncbi:Flp family type IVb pilin [Pseudomonas sp. Gutcm_11s]|uniref:Flp family type IVb pilin n=1 Tax=Pseudomonas sp. Gutcm_11s TaxID=3026088 RepID=UPI0023619BB7|nr:Flp family type IVb pilin [Pseudomonas sp. Gutcm_11s]MDD0843777.1 Flp family type IVb pilin [Pseudomonas sp. Gutcm_11s]
MKLESIKSAIGKFLQDEEGLTIVEYAVAGGLVTLGVVTVFIALGNNVCGVITSLKDAVLGTNTPVAACS